MAEISKNDRFLFRTNKLDYSRVWMVERHIKLKINFLEINEYFKTWILILINGNWKYIIGVFINEKIAVLQLKLIKNIYMLRNFMKDVINSMACI